MNAPIHENRVAGPRLVAIVGPFQSGKTSLLEGILARGGGVARQGSVREGTTVGDSSSEARSHAMSVEPNVASIDYLGDRLTFFDSPGSIEFIHDMRYAVPVCDAAVVVCEADPRKVPALQVILRELEDLGLPRILFLNKIDQATGSLRETLEMLQPASRTPLLLRQIPVWENGLATGFVDLALERAFVYREAAPSSVVEMPAGVVPEEKQARYLMLEKLADYDDALMEQLISDIDPPKDLVFDDLARELRDGRVVPVLLGSATGGHGVTRLLKALRHESPGVTHTRKRLGVEDKGPALAQVVRTIHTAHGGKLSLARVLCGAFADGATVVSSRGIEERIGGLARLMGAMSSKLTRAEEGDTVAFARLEELATGDRIADGRNAPEPSAIPSPPPATQGVAIRVKDRKDEVRLAAALAKLCEEDRALSYVQDAEMSELKLFG
ncbi:MAG: elongation factor G, partial [Roseiarcus sp.]